MQREWSVTLEERLERSTTQNLERIEPQFQISSSGVQWFDLGMVFASTGGEKFSAADIQRLLLSGQNHVRLRNGKTALLDTGAVEELQEVLLDCAPQQQSSAAQGRGRRIELPPRKPAFWNRRSDNIPPGRCNPRPPGKNAPRANPGENVGMSAAG
jgi:hypothetical protein